jgi:hypothetical protein
VGGAESVHHRDRQKEINMSDDHYQASSDALEGLGLEPLGFSRGEEFHVGAAYIGGDTITRIEEMMGGEMPSELKDLIHLVVERCAHKTGPQPSFEML